MVGDYSVKDFSRDIHVGLSKTYPTIEEREAAK